MRAFAVALTVIAGAVCFSLSDLGALPPPSQDAHRVLAAGTEKITPRQKWRGSFSAERGAELKGEGYFSDAKTVSAFTRELEDSSFVHAVKIVSANYKHPFVRIESKYQKGPTGELKLVQELAMVANQAMMLLPAGMDEGEFFGLLRQARYSGAEKVGSSGAYLVSFDGDPKDPRALESFLEAIKAVSGGRIRAEPNYIRRII